jgi:hypothetical protein
VSFAHRYVRAAALVAYSFSVGIASTRARQLIWKLARDANYEPVPRRLPTVTIDEVTKRFTTVVIPYPDWVDGNVTLLELLVLARVARERNPRAVFEIGTFNGRSTATLAANAAETAIVYTLDLPADETPSLPLVPAERAYVEKPVSGELVHSSPYASRVKQLHGDSANFDFSAFTADLVFVDGSHAYDYVLNDSNRALAMLRNGRGAILWHDYGEWEGVTRALNDLHGSDARFAGLRHIVGTTLVLLET